MEEKEQPADERKVAHRLFWCVIVVISLSSKILLFTGLVPV